MNILEFPVSLYGKLEQVDDRMSKARVRIFYKYGNRNGSYITDDFAEQLINTLPYTPLKGIYDGEDFTDHGASNDEGRIYGIVPENPNFQWELHADEDGVTREYACVDVLIFTALYEEAKEIIGKPQSMELFAPTLKYHFEIINGQRWAVFDSGCFLGLQVLGDDVEPCFEGASIFALKQSIEEIVTKLREVSNNYTIGGMSEMNTETNLTEQTLPIEETGKEDAEVTPAADDKIEGTEEGTVTEEGATETPAEEPVEEPKAEEPEEPVEQPAEEGEATEAVEGPVEGEVVVENSLESDSTIEELNNTITTLNTKIEEMQTEYTVAQEQIENLTKEVTALREYKAVIENQQKEAVMAEYAANLPKEVLDAYKEKIGEYTVLDLDKELAYEMKKAGTSVFTADTDLGYVPKDEQLTGIEAILSRYEK